MTTIFTIGFTEKTAESFFTLLKRSGTKRIFDVRLNNTSQLAGFAKKDDLRFFLREICAIDYIELPELMPESQMLKDYKNKIISWQQYEELYLNLLSKRAIEKIILPDDMNDSCLLCSEHKPHQCHRRIALEYIQSHSQQEFAIKHLY